MLIMIDTNVLVSAFLFPSPKMQHLIDTVAENHRLLICPHIIDELQRVISKKFPQKRQQLENFLYKLPYELVYTPEHIAGQIEVAIRDANDYPIIVAAIIADVDVFITGDKDFFGIEIEKPEILTPAEFISRY